LQPRKKVAGFLPRLRFLSVDKRRRAGFRGFWGTEPDSLSAPERVFVDALMIRAAIYGCISRCACAGSRCQRVDLAVDSDIAGLWRTPESISAPAAAHAESNGIFYPQRISRNYFSLSSVCDAGNRCGPGKICPQLRRRVSLYFAARLRWRVKENRPYGLFPPYPCLPDACQALLLFNSLCRGRRERTAAENQNGGHGRCGDLLKKYDNRTCPPSLKAQTYEMGGSG
jgi:hypothetical protein